MRLPASGIAATQQLPGIPSAAASSTASGRKLVLTDLPPAPRISVVVRKRPLNTQVSVKRYAPFTTQSRPTTPLIVILVSLICLKPYLAYTDILQSGDELNISR